MREWHCCVDIEGLKRNYRNEPMVGVFKGLGDKEAREYLEECLAKGWRVLPMCDCPDFDYQNGCPGIALDDEETAAKKGRASMKSVDMYKEYLNDPKISRKNKMQHVNNILSLPTHNGISKDAIIEMARWLVAGKEK